MGSNLDLYKDPQFLIEYWKGNLKSYEKAFLEKALVEDPSLRKVAHGIRILIKDHEDDFVIENFFEDSEKEFETLILNQFINESSFNGSHKKEFTSIVKQLIKTVGFATSLVLILTIGFITKPYWSSTNEETLQKEINQLKNQIISMDSTIELSKLALQEIQDRDANVHRIIFGMDPIDQDLWNGGTGGGDSFSNFVKLKNTSETLLSTRKKLEKLSLQISIQSKSLDEVEDLANKREEMLASIPAIKPVRSDKLKRNIRSLSGFGMRMHPIFKRRKMHTGIDFTAPKGTPIHATGNGEIYSIKRDKDGYGTHVIIDHGFGYKTLYANMSIVNVKKGQKVTRGQIIGGIGNTGLSTAPHLHYEVIYQGKKVNPIHYCMDGLTDEEYEQLLNMAATPNQSFD